MFNCEQRGHSTDGPDPINRGPGPIKPLVDDRSVDLLEQVAGHLVARFEHLARDRNEDQVGELLRSIASGPDEIPQFHMSESGNEFLDRTVDLAFLLFEEAATDTMEDESVGGAGLVARFNARFQEKLDEVSSGLGIRRLSIAPQGVSPSVPAGTDVGPATRMEPYEVFELVISALSWAIKDRLRECSGGTVEVGALKDMLYGVAERSTALGGPLAGAFGQDVPEAIEGAIRAAIGPMIGAVDDVGRYGGVEVEHFYDRFRESCQPRIDRMTDAFGFPPVEMPRRTSRRPYAR